MYRVFAYMLPPNPFPSGDLLTLFPLNLLFVIYIYFKLFKYKAPPQSIAELRLKEQLFTLKLFIDSN